MHGVDELDARLLLALIDNPRATAVALSETVGASRNTVQARLNRYETDGTLRSFEDRIDPAALGYPLTAFIAVTVLQRRLSEVGRALARIPEVVEVFGVSGPIDLSVRVVARDAEDLYRIAALVLAIPAVERTDTSLTMRRMVDYRVTPLLERVLGAVRRR